MILHCLFAQRKESYEGEFAPDLIAAIDEIGNWDNPDYLIGKAEELRRDPDIAYHKAIDIEIDDAEFDKLFYQSYSLKGEISNGN